MLILGIFSGLFYLACTIWLVFNLLNKKVVLDNPNKGIFAITFVALTTHAILLFLTTIRPEGLNISFVNSFSLVSWLIVLLYLMTEYRKPAETLGLLILPTASIAVFLQVIWPNQVILASHSIELQLHIFLSLLSYGLLAMAAGQSILLLIQTHYLKNKHPGGFIRSLPPLQSMESLLFQMIQIGFSLLTLALLSSFIFLDNFFVTIVEQHLLHKTILSIIAWCLFAILLWGRSHFGWRGKKAIHFTLGGFVFLMLAYFGSKMVLEIILQKV